MPTSWRVVKRQHAATAFDGKAAQRFGGRWNPIGLPAVYTSASKSLALLEVLVHLDVDSLPPMVAFRVELDASHLERLPAARLPRGWRTSRGLPATQQIGAEWLSSQRSLALAVPSSIVPEEENYILNPVHPSFADLKLGRATPFLLDPRLAG
jgi:RES domain-containing protein